MEVENMIRIDAGKVLEEMNKIFNLINTPFTGDEKVRLKTMLSDKSVEGRWLWGDEYGISTIYQSPDGKFHLATGGDDIPEKVLPAAVLRIVVEATQGYGATRRLYYTMASSFEGLEEGFQHIIEMLKLCIKEGMSILVFDSQNMSSENLPGIVVKTRWPYDELGHDWLVVIGRPKGGIRLEAFKGLNQQWYKPISSSGSPHSMSALWFEGVPK